MEPTVSLPGCEIQRVVKRKGSLVITACSRYREASCPSCGVVSKRVHGYYLRSPRDLPLFQDEARLALQAKRFRCTNPRCPRRTFAEAFPDLIERYAHRTERLKDIHQAVSTALSAEVGSKLLSKLRMSLSADTLLRAIRSRDLAQSVNPKVIGVDDWAIRKGFSYGTIIVDLAARRVVELLEGRDARTLEEWLLEHPGTRVAARDRWTDYAKALRVAAPETIQVADRWHLLNNLTEMLTRWLQSEYQRLKQLWG